MHESELERIKGEFAALPVRDEPNRTRLANELETVISLALPPDEAERYIEQIKKVSFYPVVGIVGGPDQVPQSWPKGQQKMIGLIKSVEHHLRLTPNGSKTPQRKAAPSNKIFVVHGRDHGMLRDVEAFVRRIGIEPIILMDEASRGATVIEKFERHADVSFAVVLFSPDDVGAVYGDPPEKLKRRPRQNAVLELGFFIGKLGRENTALLVDATLTGDAEYPSDLGGVIPIYYRPDSDWKMRLMREFKASDIQHDPSRA